MTHAPNRNWPAHSLLDLIGCEIPIIQAPMAGANGFEMAAAVSAAGGVGSLPCAMLTPESAAQAIAQIKEQTSSPFNLNFFCHEPLASNVEQNAIWFDELKKYYEELNLEPTPPPTGAGRAPFNDEMCTLIETVQPKVVSFHFGLPQAAFVQRIKAAGAIVLSSATSVKEAVWLQAHGCDAIIAQGYEAGGHRGMFLSDRVASQPGTLALVPQIADAVDLPIIAAGGIADGRGIAAAFALGAAGVQIGTAYLRTPQSRISDLHRAALEGATDDGTALTNVFSGRPARGLLNRVMNEIGPISPATPPFPTAGGALAPLKKAAEAQGSADFSSLWAGQAASLGRAMPAGELTTLLANEAQARLQGLN